MTLEGLNENGAAVSETITTNGESAGTASTTTFIRLNRAYVATSGTYGAANTGDIDIETTVGTTVGYITAGEGQTEQAVYTVPLGNSAVLVRAGFTTDGNSLDAQLYQRRDILTTSAPVSPLRIVTRWVGVTEGERVFSVGNIFPALTDLYMQGSGSGGSSAVQGFFELWLRRT